MENDFLVIVSLPPINNYTGRQIFMHDFLGNVTFVTKRFHSKYVYGKINLLILVRLFDAKNAKESDM